MAVQVLCACQIIRESAYVLLLFCSQDKVMYVSSNFGTLQNILSYAYLNLNNSV